MPRCPSVELASLDLIRSTDRLVVLTMPPECRDCSSESSAPSAKSLTNVGGRYVAPAVVPRVKQLVKDRATKTSSKSTSRGELCGWPGAPSCVLI